MTDLRRAPTLAPAAPAAPARRDPGEAGRTDPHLDRGLVPADPGRSALFVLSHSIRARLTDLLAEGPAPLSVLTAAVDERVPASWRLVEAHLEVMAEADFAWCLDEGAGTPRRRVWAGLDLEAFSERVDQLAATLVRLREEGDDRQATDAAWALDAAWNGRRLELDLRRRAAVFWSTPAGRRHRARLAAGTLGLTDPTPSAP